MALIGFGRPKIYGNQIPIEPVDMSKEVERVMFYTPPKRQKCTYKEDIDVCFLADTVERRLDKCIFRISLSHIKNTEAFLSRLHAAFRSRGMVCATKQFEGFVYIKRG